MGETTEDKNVELEKYHLHELKGYVNKFHHRTDHCIQHKPTGKILCNFQTPKEVEAWLWKHAIIYAEVANVKRITSQKK